MENMEKKYTSNVYDGELVETTSVLGVTVKSILGLSIVSVIIIAFLAKGTILFQGWSGIFLMIVSMVVYTMTFRMLQKDRGDLINFGIWLVNVIFTGLLAGSASVSIIFLTIKYSNNFEIMNMVQTIVPLAFGITLLIAISGIIVLPIIKTKNFQNSKTFKVVGMVIMVTMLGYGIISMISFIASLMGFNAMYDAVVGTMFNGGPVAIGFAGILLLFSAFMYVSILLGVRDGIGKEPKHFEYLASALLVNAIVNIFLDVLRLLLQLFASND